jgi:hypothetical protein
MRTLWVVSVRCLSVWVGIDRCCLDRVDAESDGGCTGPSDRSVSRSARDSSSHIGRAARHPVRVPPGRHRGGELHWSLGSLPGGIAQRTRGRVRVGDQEREEGGGESIYPSGGLPAMGGRWRRKSR